MKFPIGHVFRLICLVTTLSMICYGIYRYLLNEDVSTIQFRRFNGIDKDIYPTFTLCFSGFGIYNRRKIRSLTSGDNKEYRNFLLGRYWNEEFLKLAQKNITLEARDIITELSMHAQDEEGEIPIFEWKNGKQYEHVSSFYESYISAHDKCFSFDINIQTLPALKVNDLTRIETKLEGYYGGLFTSAYAAGRLNLFVLLAYPRQLMRQFPVVELRNMQARQPKNIVNVDTQGMEVIQQRSKSSSTCKEDWLNDDNQIIDQLISKVGCRLPGWNTTLNIPVCDSQDDFAALQVPLISTVDMKFLKNYIQPCRQIFTVISTSSIKRPTLEDLKNKDWENNDTFTMLNIHFKSVGYKELINVRAFNEESLIGNLGGYIGMFLGFAIWQVPDFLSFVFGKMKSQCVKFEEVNP